MKALICGGRGYLDWPHMFEVLDRLGLDRVIEGGARGADTGGALWAFCRGVPYVTYFADWGRHGRSAGPIRNSLMLNREKPDLAVAFPGGRGTAHMVSISEKAGYSRRRTNFPSQALILRGPKSLS